eukprot:scaffold151333_cov19-Tisochrysis_lutea.AAC.1
MLAAEPDFWRDEEACCAKGRGHAIALLVGASYSGDSVERGLEHLASSLLTDFKEVQCAAHTLAETHTTTAPEAHLTASHIWVSGCHSKQREGGQQHEGWWVQGCCAKQSKQSKRSNMSTQQQGMQE